MPVAKIHIADNLSPDQCSKLAEAVRHCVVDSLGIPPQFGKVILYPAPLHCRSVHESRDPSFVLAEVLLFIGRDQAIKQRLYDDLTKVLAQHTGVDEGLIFINLIESYKENCGLRGGRMASEVDLSS